MSVLSQRRVRVCVRVASALGALALSACWQSKTGFIDPATAVQPFAEGTYIEGSTAGAPPAVAGTPASAVATVPAVAMPSPAVAAAPSTQAVPAAADGPAGMATPQAIYAAEAGHSLTLTKQGAGYRTRWSTDNDVVDLLVAPLGPDNPDIFIYQARELVCGVQGCTDDRKKPVYGGLLRLKPDGVIERIEPEFADPSGKRAKAAGARCDKIAVCTLPSARAMKAALEKLAQAPASFTYKRQ